MAHEIRFGYALNDTLWAAVFKNDSGTWKVNIAGGDTWEAWNDANILTYDISLSEDGGGGAYTGTFPVIAAGTYHIIIYDGAVAATDLPVGQGVMYWDGTTEITVSSTSTDISTVEGKVDANTALLDQLIIDQNKVLNIQDDTKKTPSLQIIIE